MFRGVVSPWSQRVQVKPVEGEPGRWRWRITHVVGERRDVVEGTVTLAADGQLVDADPWHITAVCALRWVLDHGEIEYDRTIDLQSDVEGRPLNNVPPVTRRSSHEYRARFSLGTLGERAERARREQES